MNELTTPTTKVTATTYEWKANELAALLANQVNAKPGSKYLLEYVIETVGGDPMDRFPGRPEVTKIKLRVEEP